MNTLVSQAVDAIKTAVGMPAASHGKGPSALQKARDDVALAESKLPPAKAAFAVEQSRHDGEAFQLLARNDDGAAIARSRAAVDEAAERVRDVESAIRDAQKRLAEAADAADAESLADGWDVASTHGRRCVAAMERSQKLLDAWLATLPGVRESLEEFHAALPKKPDHRPTLFTKSGLHTAIELHTYGRSGGQICQVGMSAHVASLRPGLTEQVRDTVHRLLMADPRKGGLS